jgi:hypothetical protein
MKTLGRPLSASSSNRRTLSNPAVWAVVLVAAPALVAFCEWAAFVNANGFALEVLYWPFQLIPLMWIGAVVLSAIAIIRRRGGWRIMAGSAIVCVVSKSSHRCH